jgi:hypothetical protein
MSNLKEKNAPPKWGSWVLQFESLIREVRMPFPEPSTLVDRDLVFNFFWRFGALEAALIADPQFRQVRKKNLAPDPGWGQFTKALEEDLRAWESPSFREAATTLLDCGVRRQVVRDDAVDWELLTPAPSGSRVAFTIDTLICVRNTLFHGGKFSAREMAIARDTRVLRAAINVLDECYEIHEGIRFVIDDVAHAA